MAYIPTPDEIESIAEWKRRKHQEYLEWIERLPQPFKFFYQNRLFFSSLFPLLFFYSLVTCSRRPVEKINPHANDAIEQTRPSEPRTALPQRRPSAKP